MRDERLGGTMSDLDGEHMHNSSFVVGWLYGLFCVSNDKK
jgi:hypothetical protein